MKLKIHQLYHLNSQWNWALLEACCHWNIASFGFAFLNTLAHI